MVMGLFGGEIAGDEGEVVEAAGGKRGTTTGAGDAGVGVVFVLRLGAADVGDEGFGDVAVAGGDGEGDAGGAEADFPGRAGALVVAAAEPRVAFDEFQGAAAGEGDFVVDRFTAQEVENGEFGVFLMGKVEAGDVDADHVHAVVDAVMVLAAVKFVMPVVEAEGEEESEL